MNTPIIETPIGSTTFYVVGRTPFVCNAMSAKTRRTLVQPPAKVVGKAREAYAKHDPYGEYVRSAYRSKGDEADTRIVFPAAAFKQAMVTAAIELPGIKATNVRRLTWAEGRNVSMYGVPRLWMTVVRSANANRTPDVRTRAIIEEWATEVTVSYVEPNMNHETVVQLLAAAGLMIGVGDGRPEKGALNFGQFEIVAPDSEVYQRIVAEGGREAQDEAFGNPEMFDVETEELYEWHSSEVARRGIKVAS
jgi:hypothetical protein